MATIVMGLVIGGAVGAGAIFLLTRVNSGSQKQIDGKPLSYWLKCLDNENPTLRAEARVALPQFGVDAIRPVCDLLDEPHAQLDAADILSIMGPQTIEPLIDCLRNGTTNQRIGAIKALDRIGTPAAAATTPVVQFLGEEDIGPVAAEFVIHVGPNSEAVRVACEVLDRGSTTRQLDAIKILQRASRSDVQATEALLRASRRNTTRVKQAAFEAVCTMKPPPIDALPDMIDALESGETLAAARTGLVGLGVKAIPQLRKCTSHSSMRVRLEAVAALNSLIADPAAAEGLILFLKDNEPMVRAAAAACLQPLHSKDLGLVRRQLASPEPSVRMWAIKEVAKIQPPLIDTIAALLDDPDEQVRNEASEAIRDLWTADDPMILESPKASNEAERIRGIRLLPFLKDQKKYDMMIVAMEDVHSNVRLAAARSLGRSLHSERAVARLVEALIGDASPEVRAEAARALGRVRDQEGVMRTLRRASQDDDKTVAEAATAALRQPTSQ